MFKKFISIMGLMLLLSVLLVACGGTTVKTEDLPKYANAKTLTLSEAAKKNFADVEKKGAKLEAFSSSDGATTVKSFYADELKKKGWSENKSLLKGAELEQLSTLESVGGFVLIYTKGDQAVLYMGLPGTVGSSLGFSEVGQKDTLVIVASGSKNSF
jgi:hypothetical protein